MQTRKVEKDLQGTNNFKGPAWAPDILANHVSDAEAKGMTIIIWDTFESRKAVEWEVYTLCLYLVESLEVRSCGMILFCNVYHVVVSSSVFMFWHLIMLQHFEDSPVLDFVPFASVLGIVRVTWCAWRCMLWSHLFVSSYPVMLVGAGCSNDKLLKAFIAARSDDIAQVGLY